MFFFFYDYSHFSFTLISDWFYLISLEYSFVIQEEEFYDRIDFFH